MRGGLVTPSRTKLKGRGTGINHKQRPKSPMKYNQESVEEKKQRKRIIRGQKKEVGLRADVEGEKEEGGALPP